MPTVKCSTLSRPDLAGRWPLIQAQGSPGSLCSTCPALLLCRARQHRKVAVRSPRPRPRAARDTLWVRSRQGPHNEKVMPVPSAPASTARAPNATRSPAPLPRRWPRTGHAGLQEVLGTPDLAGWAQARTLMISCFQLGGRALGWGWGGNGKDAHHSLRSHPGLPRKSQLVPD